MRRFGVGAALAVAVLGLALLPMKASAALELDIGFDPAEVCPGETAQFFFSLENVGDTEELVEISVMLTFEDEEFGPFTGELPLAAGELISKELAFPVPPPAPPGTLTVSVTATDSDGEVSDEASITVLECMGPGRSPSPRNLINRFRRTLSELGVR